MKTNPTGNIQIPEEDYFLWEVYKFKCVICQSWAVCLHECPPKSLNPKWKEHPEDRYSVCEKHHEQMHTINWKTAKEKLDYYRELFYGKDIVERIKNARK